MKPRRRHIALAPLILAAGMALSLLPDRPSANDGGDCGYSGVNVDHDDPAELQAACTALTDVLAYFGRMGFNIVPEVSIRFADRRTGPVADRDSARSYFDAGKSQVVLYRASGVNPWGLTWTPQLAGSFLRHELAHMAILQAVGEDPERLPREWHEFMAYAVQFDLMPLQLRKDVLSAGEEVRPFEELSAINEFTFRMNPDVFSVAAYKTYLAKGAENFAGQLLRAEILPPPFSFPFPVFPQPSPRQED